MVAHISLPLLDSDEPASGPVCVNGQEVPRALLDTGASVTVVNRELVNELNLQVLVTVLLLRTRTKYQ